MPLALLHTSVRDADVIFLAQAFTTSAQRLATTTVPILSSPRPDLAAAAKTVGVG